MENTEQILVYSSAITAAVVAIGKLVSMLTKGGVISTTETREAGIAAHWKRLEDLADDLRADNDRLRKQLVSDGEALARCHKEIERLRKVAP